MDNFEYLDDKLWSPLWEDYLSKATLFDPSSNHEILCILSSPGEKSGILIFTEEDVFFSDTNALKMLQDLTAFHSFSDYHVLASCLKKLGHFGKYKMPWVCPYFTLFPLEGTDHTIWINPLKIAKVFNHEETPYVQMTNGLYLVLPIQKQPFMRRAEIACLALATIRRGIFHYVIRGEVPLDFLFFPNTSFAKTLSKRIYLKEFPTAIGEINRLYQITYSLHHCESLIYDPYDIHNIHWI
ncbi:hypothetical protein KQI58_00700 [Enterococcus raffinosus]|uniref:hypothetical protein n=1 Tax=Enterococcus raffinosus TaxID=71452 RepID=UPI001C0F89C0|nr:hypothetical protein [Enterococcus raffinosus]MBU5359590.1 hypothetical protein [Enterococcus raffinosus]